MFRSVKKQNRKQKQRNSATVCRTSEREDSRVLLERCDRLCDVEVMSGRPAGVIHSVPAKNKTEKQRIKKETRSPLGAGPKSSVCTL